MVEKIFDAMSTKKMQQVYIIAAIFACIVLIFCVRPFATDGYEDISDRATLDYRVAQAIANHQSELYIDYSGEDFANMKNWFKQDFDYDNLVSVGGEYAAYNYNGAKYTYWSYSNKKRVKVVISYKDTVDEKAYVDAFVEDYINTNGLRNMSSYDAMKNVHDYLTKNISYAEGINSLYTAVTEKKTNCYGYTLLNHIFLEKLGIENRTTYGQMNLPHIWNVVKLDSQWYNIDITWDTAKGGYEYFLVSTSTIKKSHTIWGNFVVDCPSDYVVPKVEETPKEDIPEVEETDDIITPEENVIPPIQNEPIEEETPSIDENTENVEEKIDESVSNNDVVIPNDEVKTPDNKDEMENIETTNPPDEKVDSTENVEEVEEESAVTPSEDVSNSNGNSNTDSSNSNSNKTQSSYQKLIKLLKQLRMLFGK